MNENLNQKLNDILLNIVRKYSFSEKENEDIAQDAAILLFKKYGILHYEKQHHNLIWQVAKFTTKNANKSIKKYKYYSTNYTDYNELKYSYSIEYDTNLVINGKTPKWHLYKFIRTKNSGKNNFKKRNIKYRIFIDHFFKGLNINDLAIKYNKKYNTITSILYVAKIDFTNYLTENQIDIKKYYDL